MTKGKKLARHREFSLNQKKKKAKKERKKEKDHLLIVNMSSKQPAVKLDDEQIAELREIFRSFDRNKDGSLTQLELGSLLRSLGLKPSPDQLETLIQKADTNSNGLVEFSEFVALVAPELLPEKSPYSEEQLKQLFRMFDRDGNGFITAAELAHSMAKLGHALTAEELTGMIKEADTDGDGRISFQEFSQAITSAALGDFPLIVCWRMCSVRHHHNREKDI
ncbi:putative calcium-binding protein cml11 [Turnera subulata]|uniref:Calcium-binding protein cml11 n=1 Tax=Turnera subulata TaxID=218843 RepID=A0A9Q0FWR5_9ROSI|nr:putative calcium-binding protein cml11 [Turnera subulata]